MGVANLSNYKNRQGVTGLWYRCNEQKHNRYDIATLGQNVSGAADGWDGMRERQGYEPGYTPAYPSGLPAANTFSSGTSAYNLYNLNTECHAINYYYATSAGGTPLHEPGAAVTGYTYDASANKISVAFHNGCPIPGATWDGATRHALYSSAAGLGASGLTMNMGPDERDMVINSNINYYSNDDNGMQHRDSLIYWLNTHESPSTRMSVAYELLANKLPDSAYSVYDAIVTTDTLSGRDSVNYGYWGKRLLLVSLSKSLRDSSSTSMFTALADSVMYMTDSAYGQSVVKELTDIVANSAGWPRVMAKSMLMGCSITGYDSLLLAQPDTLLYPAMADSTFTKEASKGVLLVTEFSTGPAHGCEYVELSVANCATDRASYVDVKGWIINDNSGIFNGACDDGYGITRGHFRLANDDVWAHVPVGSRIVIYNHDSNCYNLPSAYSVDSMAGVYYVPAGVSGNHLQQYRGLENSSQCSYCSENGPTNYQVSTQWANVIDLDSVLDGMQTVCPGCLTGDTTTPKFYHGAGYYDEGAQNGALKSTPVLLTGGGAKKYEFTGATGNDVVNAAKWQVSAADQAGAMPASLGHVNSILIGNIIDGNMNLPCCTTQQQNKGGKEKDKTVATNATTILRVYPNPATSSVNFEFDYTEKGSVKISDVTGRTMNNVTISKSRSAIVDVKGLAPGIYLYIVTTDGKTQSGKFVVGD